MFVGSVFSCGLFFVLAVFGPIAVPSFSSIIVSVETQDDKKFGEGQLNAS